MADSCGAHGRLLFGWLGVGVSGRGFTALASDGLGIGPEAATARPALTLLLKDADAEVRMVAAESMRKISQETGR
jgi:hypothetical protein